MLAIGPLGPRPVTSSEPSGDSGILADVPRFSIRNGPHAQFLEIVSFRLVRKLGFSLLPSIFKTD